MVFTYRSNQLPVYFFFPAAWSRNVLNSDSSEGTQRSSRIPDQPPTSILSFGTRPQTFRLAFHGCVYSLGSVNVNCTRRRLGVGRSQRSSSTAWSLIGYPY